MKYKFILNHAPVALARPRFLKKNFRVYDEQAQYKQIAKCCLLQQMRSKKQIIKLRGHIRIKATFHLPIPKNLSRAKKKAVDGEYHNKRPDLDNFIKMYLDVMNGLVFEDDSQVVFLIAEKKYSQNPKSVIYVEEIN